MVKNCLPMFQIFAPSNVRSTASKFWRKFEKEDENVKLLMVGDGPERAACRVSRETIGNFANHVNFVGKRENIADYLGIADVFLLPSELESFGLAALEAQACEVPVVATRIGGIPEVVTDGETGI